MLTLGDSHTERVKTALSSFDNLSSNLHYLEQTDASETGLGNVLSQEFDGEGHPIIYISWKLTTRWYTTVEWEALGSSGL